MVCAMVKMLFLTCLAARFSGLCQENVKPEPDGTKAAIQAEKRLGPTTAMYEAAPLAGFA